MKKASPSRLDRVNVASANSDPYKRIAGFSLVELMFAVAIVSILASLAIPAFSSYLNRSRAQEATDFLNVIRLRQESYRAEFGQYCNVSSPNPAALGTPASAPKAWTPAPANWQQLGANPDGWVRFSYDTQAGLPGVTPATNPWGLDGSDFWYFATAVGDLDDDGTQVRFDVVSGRRDVWCSEHKGWE
jgi:prepilin-type N-terminal cleavage/methylation domain-containing protein